VRRLKAAHLIVISAREDYAGGREIVDGVPVFRIGEGRLYRRLFRKATRFDPYPLHRRVAKTVNREAAGLVRAHQLKFPVMDFLRSLKRRIPLIVHAHVTAARFDEARSVADRYLAVSQHVKDKLVAEKNFPPARRDIAERRGHGVSRAGTRARCRAQKSTKMFKR
jgi:hypothetical protein